MVDVVESGRKRTKTHLHLVFRRDSQCQHLQIDLRFARLPKPSPKALEYPDRYYSHQQLQSLRLLCLTTESPTETCGIHPTTGFTIPQQHNNEAIYRMPGPGADPLLVLGASLPVALPDGPLSIFRCNEQGHQCI